jgi:hypothetical protein
MEAVNTGTKFPLILHGPHRNRRIQQFFCFMRIRCRGNVFTGPLTSNDKGYTQTYREQGDFISLSLFFAYFSNFEKLIGGLSDHYEITLLSV